MNNYFGMVFPLLMVILLMSLNVEGKVGLKRDCSNDYSPYCNCDDSPPFSRSITCNISTSQNLDGIRKKLNATDLTSMKYRSVRLVMATLVEIPSDVLGGARTHLLILSCSDRSTPLGTIHPDAFRSTMNHTRRLEIEDCDLMKTSFAFLSQFPILTDLEITTSSVKQILNMPYLPQLKSISFSGTTHFELWHSPSQQTPNLEFIFMRYMSDLDDRKMESIMTSMTRNFTYPKLSYLSLSDNKLTFVPPIVSTFPALTELYLSGNPIRTLAAGAVKKGSTQLHNLVFSKTQLTTIEPGAFVGDFSSTKIHLSDNLMTRFPSSVFRALLKSMVNHTGYINVMQNPVAFDCNLAWLLVHNRDLLPKVYGEIANGTDFEDLNNNIKELTNCSSKVHGD